MSQHEFYAARGAEARADAESATLTNVRDRSLRAASAWEAMAARARRTDVFRARQVAEKEAAALETATIVAAPIGQAGSEASPAGSEAA